MAAAGELISTFERLEFGAMDLWARGLSPKQLGLGRLCPLM